MTEPSAAVDVARERRGPEPQPVEIRIEGVHKSFGDTHVLRGVDLVIYRGEMTAIVGSSGCGKTVVLDHMIGRHQPDRGRVLVANHDLEGTPLVDLAFLDEEGMDQLRIHWAVVFQGNALFSDTVFENIALWLREVKNLDRREIRQRARAAVTAVGLDPGTVLGKQREELSGGMAKRVAVARAVAMKPTLVFYDEPTTGLDPGTATQIHELIGRTHQDDDPVLGRRTSVIVTHDKDLLYRLRPRVVMLHEGKVFFDGPYERFERSDSPVIRPYCELMPILHKRPIQNGNP